MAENGNHTLTEDDLKSMKAAKGVFRKGNTNQDVVNFYDQWVKDGNYQQDTEPVRYRAHILACEEVEDFFPKNRDKVKVLDVGAGTGRAGEELVKKGFKVIDALEPSACMLEEAAKLNIYGRLINDGIGFEQLPVEDNFYDMAVVAGAMGEGHIPCMALHEMARVVRPGGLISISMREEFLTSCEEYNGRLEPLMEKMVEDGEWKMVSRKQRPNYYCGKPGIVYKFQPC